MAKAGAVPRFYVASSEPAGATNSCACGNFLRKDSRNLAVARKDQLDVMGFTSEGLKILATTRLAYAIASIHPVKPSWSENDLLFVLLHSREIHILEFGLDFSGRPCITTRASGTAIDKVGRLSELGPFVSVDPNNRCIALHIYESLIRIIPLNREPTEPRELETFNVRIDENWVKSIAFLHNAESPSLALLYRDSTGSHVVTYEVDFREKDLKTPTAPHVEMKNIETESLSLVAVPGTNRGVLACGIEILTYMDAEAGGTLTAQIKKENRGIGCVYTVLSNTIEATKVLVGDMRGYLHVIQLKKSLVKTENFSRVTELGMIGVGRLIIASCAAYLDNRVLFIGSRTGDSQIIRFREDAHPETGNLFDVLESIPNLGCIGDFTLVRPDQGSQPQMIVCSGFGPGTSARIIRSGIGVHEITSLEIPTARQIFAINSTSTDETSQDMLVLSFLSETRILKMEKDIGDFDDLTPDSVGTFLLSEPTFLVAKVAGLIIQVTRKSIRAIEPGTLAMYAEWTPSNSSYQIGSASCFDGYVVAGAYDTLLIVDFTNPTNATSVEVKLESQISAVDVHSFAHQDPTVYIAVTTWKMDLLLLAAPEWKIVARSDLNSDVFARSIMLLSLDNVDYILVGLGDGSLQYIVLDKNREKLGQSKRVNVGTQPTSLQSFVARGMASIFICNDRPSVIHSSGGKLIFSNVNMKHVYAVCPLNSSAYPNSLAIITDSGLIIGRMDEIQKLHTRCISLPGCARRVAYQQETSTFGFITMDEPTVYDLNASEDGPESEEAMEEDVPIRQIQELPTFKLIVTDQTNYHVLATYQFNRHEAVNAITSGQMGKDSRTFYIVGTGQCKQEEKETSVGRIIVFQYADKQLTIVAEKAMKGFTAQLQIFKDKLLLLCGSSVRLMGWNENGDLVPEHHLARFIQPCAMKIKGDFVLVADMMRSVSVLAYRVDENKFDIIGEEPYPIWPNTCEFLDDDVYVVSSASGNISFLRRDADASSGNIKDLNEIACINLADSVNVIRKGTLLPDSALGERLFAQNSLIMATVSGSILHVLSIDENTYHILKQVVDRLCRSLMPFGRITSEKYNAVLDDNGSFRKPAYGVINGDLVELIGSMNNEEIRDVVTGIKDSAGLPVSMESLSRIVEDLSRSH